MRERDYGAAVSVGAFIQSMRPIFVQRSIHADAGGAFWSAGTDATATRIP
jgi:hypothetical protein